MASARTNTRLIRFFNRVTILGFMLILLLPLVGNYIVDPFDANQVFRLGLEKREVTFRLNYWNWKLPEFRRLRAPNLLIGDSRMDRLSASHIRELSGKQFYNFSCGGATVAETIATFWACANTTTLESVYFGVNFDQLTDHSLSLPNRSQMSHDILEWPWMYYSDLSIARNSLAVLAYNLGLRKATTERPSVSREQFWKNQLADGAGHTLNRYLYPRLLLDEFREISNYCDKMGIRLTFVYMPIHVDLQAKVDEFGFRREYELTKEELKRIARVIDYDYSNSITQNPENFADPFHMKRELYRHVEEEIFGSTPWIARISEGSNASLTESPPTFDESSYYFYSEDKRAIRHPTTQEWQNVPILGSGLALWRMSLPWTVTPRSARQSLAVPLERLEYSENLALLDWWDNEPQLPQDSRAGQWALSGFGSRKPTSFEAKSMDISWVSDELSGQKPGVVKRWTYLFWDGTLSCTFYAHEAGIYQLDFEVSGSGPSPIKYTVGVGDSIIDDGEYTLERDGQALHLFSHALLREGLNRVHLTYTNNHGPRPPGITGDRNMWVGDLTITPVETILVVTDKSKPSRALFEDIRSVAGIR